MIPADSQHGAFSVHASAWGLNPAVAMLNHGSFGACPLAVLEAQRRLRTEMERQPVRFLTRQIQPLLDQSRQVLCDLIGADPAEVVFVSNVTAAVNCVLRGLRLAAGDELLLTDHGYNACRNVADYVAGRCGGRVVVATVPVPIESPQQVVEAVLNRVTDRTRLAMLDHVTSPTAVVFPIEELVEQLGRRGVDTLVNGAHAPGMLPLDVRRIGAAYYAGNCHKWLCARRGPVSCPSAATAARACTPTSSVTAITAARRAAAASTTCSTGSARSTRRLGFAWARRFAAWARWSRAASRP